MNLKKILLATDLSTEGERPLRAIAELARNRSANIVLLHVIENPGAPPVGTTFPAPSFLPGTKEEIERARGLLAERKAKFPAGIEVVTDVVVAPSVPHAIADYAAKNGCDAIALSTHGRSGFRRLVMGSVAECVLRVARVPVIAFPRQE